MTVFSILKSALPVVKAVGFIAVLEVANKGLRGLYLKYQKDRALVSVGLENQIDKPINLSKGLTNEFLDAALIVKTATNTETGIFITPELFKGVILKLDKADELSNDEIISIIEFRELLANFAVNLVCLELTPIESAKRALAECALSGTFLEVFKEFDGAYDKFYKFCKIFEENCWVKKIGKREFK